MKRPDPFAELHVVPPELADIDIALTAWGLWVTARNFNGHASSPGFEGYRAPSAYRPDLTARPARPQVDRAEALAVESAVARLPELHRVVVRGWYAYRMPPYVICRRAATAPRALRQVLDDGRRMVRNLMRSAGHRVSRGPDYRLDVQPLA